MGGNSILVQLIQKENEIVLSKNSWHLIPICDIIAAIQDIKGCRKNQKEGVKMPHPLWDTNANYKNNYGCKVKWDNKEVELHLTPKEKVKRCAKLAYKDYLIFRAVSIFLYVSAALLAFQTFIRWAIRPSLWILGIIVLFLYLGLKFGTIAERCGWLESEFKKTVNNYEALHKEALEEKEREEKRKKEAAEREASKKRHQSPEYRAMLTERFKAAVEQTRREPYQPVTSHVQQPNYGQPTPQPQARICTSSKSFTAPTPGGSPYDAMNIWAAKHSSDPNFRIVSINQVPMGPLMVTYTYTQGLHY